MTLASSDSVVVARISPWWMKTKPPGTAKALMLSSLMTKNSKSLPPSGLCDARRWPMVWMYSFTSGSSSSAP